MKNKKKKLKKRIIIIVILLIISLIVFFNKISKKADEELKIETEKIEKRNIAISVSANGNIKSTTSKDIVAALTGFKIESINVKEGQKINSGDVICTFDTSTLKDNLVSAQESLNLTNKQSNIGNQNAQRNLADAINNKNTQVNASQSAVNQTKKAYDDAVKKLNELNSQIANFDKQLTSKKDEMLKVNAEYENAKQIKAKAQNEYEAQKAIVSNAMIDYEQASESEKALKQIKLDEANNKLMQLEIELNASNTAYHLAENNYNSLENVILMNKTYEELKESKKALEAQVESLKTAYDNAVNTYNATVSSSDSAIATMQDQIESSKINSDLNVLTQKTQINAYQKQISDGIIKSNVSGTVTAINFKQGDIYTGTAIATINGCEEFIIEAEIDEYDIADIKEGMQVLIKTDATRDEEIKGNVVFVSTSATVNGLPGTVSNNATYTVKIALLENNERLRLGMNARLNIITDSREAVWSVPYDSILEREDGTKYIKVVKDNSVENVKEEDIEELDVKIGLESTYYVEIISDKLKDGMRVVIPEVKADNSIETLINLMGADAGI